jgi:hypothetical protein
MDEARRQQFAIWRQWTVEQRIAAGLELADLGRRWRDERLRQRFPNAETKAMGWLRVRSALGLPLRMEPP